MNTPLVIGDGSSASWDLLVYISQIIPIHLDPDVANWEEIVMERSPELGPYFIRSVKEKSSEKPAFIKLSAVEPEWMSEMGSHIFSPPSDMGLSGLGKAIALVCAAGGTEAFIGLLKTWIEEKQERTIIIKKDKLTLEVDNPVSQADQQRLVEIFEEHLKKHKEDK